MKKLITILLALSMVISLLPATFAAELTNPSNVKIVYSLANFTNNEKLNTVDMKDRTYGTWYYYMNGNLDTTGKNVQVKIGGTNKRLNVSSHGGWAAFVINVPVAGEYEVYQDYFQASSGCVGGMHIIPFNSSYDSSLEIHNAVTAGTFDTGASINYYNASQKWITSTSALATKYFNKGEYLVVYTMKETPAGAANNSIFISTLTLNGGTDTVPMKTIVSTDDPDINKDEKTQLTTTTYLSDATLSTTETVSYSSSDDIIATVDENGLVTGTGDGIATITATVTNSSYGVTITDSVDINVTNPNLSGVKTEYDMFSPGKGMNIGDVTYTQTKGSWKYAYSSHNGTTHKSVNVNDCLSLESFGGVGGYVAITINVPAKGDYNLTFEHLKGPNGITSGAMYIAPSEVAISDAANNNKYLITDRINYNDTALHSNPMNLGTVSFDEAGEYNVIYKALVYDSYAMYPGDIILNGGTGAAYVGTVTATDAELEVGDTITPTALLFNSSTGTAITSGVTLTSSNPAVAVIEEDGTTVKAVGAGKATISATCADPAVGNVIGTEITVTIPTIIPEETEITDTKVSFTFVSSEAEAGSVSAKGYNTVGEVEIGTSVEATATANDGYEFAYWRNGAGTVLSTKATETFKFNTNTAVYAEFVALPDENASEVPVYFYNGNGNLLESKNVTKGTLFGEAKIANPSLTGFAFKHWSDKNEETPILDTDTITALTRAVAIYKDADTTFTVKNGTATVATGKKYGDPVMVNGSENFSCWKLGDKVMSYEKNFTFNVYGNITLTEVTDETMEKAPVLVLDKVDGNYFLTYNAGNYELMEAGILFGSNATIDSYESKAFAKESTGQFTAQPNGEEENTTARGYMICKDGETFKVIYAD